ncbi:subtilisin-like protease SBT1.2 [Andrographis paniculata]|uniref:subtilisin-like protease SBT1.2 n=1 Tax=Andrographis paniculata TaxID=175694 RepID=UPI0021E71C94|nr:subtilisin-like protease SBT1.2 [Andrographis paniculata]
MAALSNSHIFSIFSLHLLLCLHAHNSQTYVVQLHPSSLHFSSKLQWHLSFLEEDGDSSSRLLYSYSAAMEGFAAYLSKPEVKKLERLREVMAVRPDRRLGIHTTYSYQFLGLNTKNDHAAWITSRFGRGSIIGVIDTGVWPESPSFGDRGMPRVPRKWKGICQQGQGFSASKCNRKLIGARYFKKGHRMASQGFSRLEYGSPRDSHGHGTHTASIAGGAPVPSASVLRNGAGEARGMAPSARTAIYKACWSRGCYSSDILAAIDSAIKDGVDVLSLSLGGFPAPFYDDVIAIGSFRAMEHGISVVCSAGNNGPIQNSVTNAAPWIATIGASTVDRRFPAIVRLSNRKYLFGESMYPEKGPAAAAKEFELVYITGGKTGSAFCLRGSLPRRTVRGKMVVCDRGVNQRAEKGQVVKEAGGAAMILANTEMNMEEDSVDVHVLPATLIGFEESVQLKNFINSSRKPKGRIIFGGTIKGRYRAPAVARFSSRGPNLADPSILKPDMIAPGVNIIAAWPQNLSPSRLTEDSRRVNFNVMSGTSMACPHVSGLAALIYSAHSNWSPAAVKSALMTTADVCDNQGKPVMDGDKPAELFAVGAGHVNPERAINPGLIYDIQPDDYITHLCSLRYPSSDIFSITQRNVSCHDILQKNRGFSLNYPSFSVIFTTGDTRKRLRRQITNVGIPNSIYSLKMEAPRGVDVTVRPHCLIFNHTYQTLIYRVWFISKKKSKVKDTRFAQGHLTWVETTGSHRARSPISVTWLSTKRNNIFLSS